MAVKEVFLHGRDFLCRKADDGTPPFLCTDGKNPLFPGMVSESFIDHHSAGNRSGSLRENAAEYFSQQQKTKFFWQFHPVDSIPHSIYTVHSYDEIERKVTMKHG